MNAPIAITIPIGPYESNMRWIQDTFDSITRQTMRPNRVILVLDGGDPNRISRNRSITLPRGCAIEQFYLPWPSGVANAFNTGVALAGSDLVIMLGSDDMLFPHAVENAYTTWRKHQNPHAYYYFAVKYSTGYEQNIPCNAAMVTRQLWELNGGFPIEGALGACDTMLISRMLAANGRLGKLISVCDTTRSIDYWYRAHTDTATTRSAKWFTIIHQVRSVLTDEAVNL
jgi:glycosyltransferase involved in cell wall biosynthesis